MIRSIGWIAAGLAASAILAGIGWWALVAPAQVAVAAAEEQVRRSADALAQDRRRLEELAAIARHSSDLERDAAQLVAEAPTWSMDRMVAALEQAVGRDGATLDTVSPAEPRDLTSRLVVHPLSITASGSYEQLRSALTRLQRLRPRLTIGSVSITSREPGEPLSMVVSATAYAASPPPGTPEPKPTAPPLPDRPRDPFAPVIPPTPVPRPRPITVTAVVVVDRVTARAITMLVRGRSYRAPVGGSVADGVRFIRSVSTRCADLRYGQRTTRACEGRTVVLSRRVPAEGRPASPRQVPPGRS